MDYSYLHQYIPVGVENAIHQADLAIKLHTSPAAAKNIVRAARRQGLEICSGTEGYYFAASEQEINKYVGMMRKQAFSRIKTASPIINTLTTIKGQMSLTDCLEGVFDEVADDGKK